MESKKSSAETQHLANSIAIISVLDRFPLIGPDRFPYDVRLARSVSEIRKITNWRPITLSSVEP
jgi:hypothetical protein